MANGPARAEFWKKFVTTRCEYPAAERLRAQLADAEFYDFCECGCNSFAVKASKDALPLANTHNGPGHGAVYEADFNMPDDWTLEIILFANADGNLDYIEVDCCANSYPVPDLIEVGDQPFRTWASKSLLP